MLKILLNAGKSPNLGFAYDLFLILTTIINVKIAMTWGQSAGVRSIHTSEASQRLHAEDLSYAYLVGLFEGDGYFSVTKKVSIYYMNLVLNCLLKTYNSYIKLRVF
jgi:hypothetical protein